MSYTVQVYKDQKEKDALADVQHRVWTPLTRQSSSRFPVHVHCHWRGYREDRAPQSGGDALSIVGSCSYFVFISPLMRTQLSSRELCRSLVRVLQCTETLHQLETVTGSWIIFAQRMVFLLTYFNILAHREQGWVNRKQTVLLTQQSPLRLLHVHFFSLPLYIIPRAWYLALLRITKSDTNLQTQLLAECQLFLLIFFFFNLSIKECVFMSKPKPLTNEFVFLF